jgi:hypothetical protein
MAAITPSSPCPKSGLDQGKARAYGSPQGRPDSEALSLPGARLYVAQISGGNITGAMRQSTGSTCCGAGQRTTGKATRRVSSFLLTASLLTTARSPK